MKTHELRKPLLLAALAVSVGAFSLGEVGANPACRKAKGKYTGELKGVAKAAGIGSTRLPKTDTTLKLPAGKGKVVVKIKGAPRVTGKINECKVRQGGKKVIQTGKTRVPASLTGPIGALSGPFKAVTDVSQAKPTTRATTTLKQAPFTVKGIFTGSQ